MGELVKRLRAAIVYVDCDDCMGDQLKTEAAGRIEALEALLSEITDLERTSYTLRDCQDNMNKIGDLLRAAQEDKA